jgi:hypothetical protein
MRLARVLDGFLSSVFYLPPWLVVVLVIVPLRTLMAAADVLYSLYCYVPGVISPDGRPVMEGVRHRCNIRCGSAFLCE